jgi:hypothetical protein
MVRSAPPPLATSFLLDIPALFPAGGRPAFGPLACATGRRGLRFLVLDELHTYRGRQGEDVAMLVRRVRDRLNPDLLCVGTSATMATEGSAADRACAVAAVASRLFGAPVPCSVLQMTTPHAFEREGFAAPLLAAA